MGSRLIIKLFKGLIWLNYLFPFGASSSFTAGALNGFCKISACFFYESVRIKDIAMKSSGHKLQGDFKN